MRLHNLICGVTLSGKTTLAKIMQRGYQNRGIKTAVLDPILDREWTAEFVTANSDAFLAFAKRSHSMQLFIDEGGESLGRYNNEYRWLTTTGRHHGHCANIITHRPAQLDVTLRSQCTTVYAFSMSKSDAKSLADEYDEPLLLDCTKFRPGQFISVGRFVDTVAGQIDFARKTVVIRKAGKRAAIAA